MIDAPLAPQTILGLMPYLPIQPRAARPPQQPQMIATITLAGTITAQGPVVQGHADGRVTIADGAHRLTGSPIGRRLHSMLSALPLAAMAWGGAPSALQEEALPNDSHAPTRKMNGGLGA